MIDWIRAQWGQIDLLVYSLATGVRIMADGQRYQSVLKSMGHPIQGWGLDLGQQQLIRQEMPVASAEEVLATERVMGGEYWQNWVQQLHQAGCLAPGFRTLSFSYEGPALTHAWYRDGTLGHAKQHLQQTAPHLRPLLTSVDGDARAVICKALVTKASLVIPFLPVYLMLLMKVMKTKGLHEMTTINNNFVSIMYC